MLIFYYILLNRENVNNLSEFKKTEKTLYNISFTNNTSSIMGAQEKSKVNITIFKMA